MDEAGKEGDNAAAVGSSSAPNSEQRARRVYKSLYKEYKKADSRRCGGRKIVAIVFAAAYVSVMSKRCEMSNGNVMSLVRAQRLYTSFYSPRSIYEFLFPEISLCDETPLALLGDDETLGGQ